jgi:hypothetical protein
MIAVASVAALATLQETTETATQYNHHSGD